MSLSITTNNSTIGLTTNNNTIEVNVGTQDIASFQALADSAAASAATAAAIVGSGNGLFPDGNAGAPSISFSGDTNNGIFRPTTDSVAISTASVERMRITSNGNVGIGTSSPAYRLQVPATGAVAADLGGILIGGNGTDIVGNIGPLSLQATGNNFISLYTNGAERLFISGAGNVGIGTTSPDYKLSVAGTALRIGVVDTSAGEGWSNTDLGGFVFRTHFGLQERTGMYAVGNFATGSYEPDLLFRTNATERMRIDSSGNVGIGTNAPGRLLDVLGGNIRVVRAGGGIVEMGDENNIVSVQSLPVGIASDMVFKLATVERMRIDASGNLLLGGTASPASATKSLAIFNGTVPTASVTDGVVLYAQDVSSSSELRVRDEAGNITTLSPHSFDLIPEGPSEDMAWSYYSERDGKRINVDMLKAIRLIEQITGEKLVHIA